MIIDETSIQRQLQRDMSSRPPFCPNQKCSQHFESSPENFRKYGFRKIKRFPYHSQRMKCKTCSKCFSTSKFRLDYQVKTWGHFEEIFFLRSRCLSLREIGRRIKHSEHRVRGRVTRMARRGLLLHAKITQNLAIHEPIVFDGLENFAFSQYQLNNVNHAVGKKSLFTYDFNFAPMNRKGRMSPRQVGRKRQLEAKHGPFPRDAIRTTARDIFARLHAKACPMELYSDQHFQYRRAVEWDLKHLKIRHITVSSKIARNFRNDLFAINNVDMQVRHNLAAFKRETIAFAKHSVAMMESFTLNVVFRNYMRPKFWGTHRSDPESSKKSPAMELRLTTKILSFDEFFSQHVFASQVSLNKDWKNFYHHVDPLSRQPIRYLA